MSVRERRLQLLLDHERYDRVAEVAAEEGRSVSAAIRSAIDIAYPSSAGTRRAAVEYLLNLPPDEVTESVDTSWEATRDAVEAESIERFS